MEFTELAAEVALAKVGVAVFNAPAYTVENGQLDAAQRPAMSQIIAIGRELSRANQRRFDA